MARQSMCELADSLGRQAEAVCRHYLSNGRRHGGYWLVGDVRNSPGRSMFVRLRDSARGRAGKWLDAATGEHGDLLDVIRVARGLADFGDVLREARDFLNLAQPHPEKCKQFRERVPTGSAEAAQRLWAISRPIAGTIAETYLRRRGVATCRDFNSLRFHPRCFYRPDDGISTETWPALIAAVTDASGNITGVQRTWLARDGSAKAPISAPRKAMGDILGHAVRFGRPGAIMAAGEGIETVLSLKCALPHMAVVAALSSAHLGAFQFPADLRRIYIVRDNDHAGDAARDRLIQRANDTEIDAIVLSPRLGDFNEDLSTFGMRAVQADIRLQLAPEDVARFMQIAA